jgi:hypothetical protein
MFGWCHHFIRSFIHPPIGWGGYALREEYRNPYVRQHQNRHLAQTFLAWHYFSMKKFADQMADLDERRKTAGITYVELSKASDTALVNLSRYRNGHQQPTVDRWIVIQEALEKLIADRAAAMNALASS